MWLDDHLITDKNALERYQSAFDKSKAPRSMYKTRLTSSLKQMLCATPKHHAAINASNAISWIDAGYLVRTVDQLLE